MRMIGNGEYEAGGIENQPVVLAMGECGGNFELQIEQGDDLIVVSIDEAYDLAATIVRLVTNFETVMMIKAGLAVEREQAEAE